MIDKLFVKIVNVYWRENINICIVCLDIYGAEEGISGC